MNIKQKRNNSIVVPWNIEKMKFEFTTDVAGFKTTLIQGLVKLRGEKREWSQYLTLIVPNWKLEKNPGNVFAECVAAVNLFNRKVSYEHKAKGE